MEKEEMTGGADVLAGNAERLRDMVAAREAAEAGPEVVEARGEPEAQPGGEAEAAGGGQAEVIGAKLIEQDSGTDPAEVLKPAPGPAATPASDQTAAPAPGQPG